MAGVGEDRADIECPLSVADMCAAKSDVRFTPDSDHESGTCANGHVRFTFNSGHVRCTGSCLLWANSGHSSWRAIRWTPRKS